MPAASAGAANWPSGKLSEYHLSPTAVASMTASWSSAKSWEKSQMGAPVSSEVPTRSTSRSLFAGDTRYEAGTPMAAWSSSESMRPSRLGTHVRLGGSVGFTGSRSRVRFSPQPARTAENPRQASKVERRMG